MAKENHANYAKIGFALVLGTVATVAALVYIGGAGGRGEELLAETYCESVVSGLSVGSEVNFRGVKVGEVREITFVGREYEGVTEEDSQKILIIMALNGKLYRPGGLYSPEETIRRHVERGLRATVASSGITGLMRVELNYPKAVVEPAAISWRPERVCIPPAPSILESFSDSAVRVMSQLNDMDFRSAWSNMTDFTASVSRLADSVNAIVDTQRAALPQILGEVEEAMAAIRGLAGELRDNPSLLLRPRDPLPLPETE